jgi:hypothetical protein
MGDLYMRQYHLPKAIVNLKRKLEALEAEARQVGTKEALTCLEAANAAWDREAEIALLQAQIEKRRRDGTV